MKKQMLMLGIVLFLLTTVNAMYGGDSEIIYHFDKCHNLTVDVIGKLEIDKREYSFENCSIINESINNNSWFCDCYDGFNLTMKTDTRTVNEYNITITYFYNEIIQDQTSSVTATGTGGTNSRWVCGEWSECTNGKQEQLCQIDNIKKVNIRDCKTPTEENENTSNEENESSQTNETLITNETNRNLLSNNEQNDMNPITGFVVGTTAGKVSFGGAIFVILILLSLFIIRKLKK